MTEQLYSRLSDIISKIASIIVGSGIILALIFSLAKPWLDPFLSLPEEMEELQQSLRIIKESLDLRGLDVVEFIGNGQIINNGTYKPGDVVAVTYFSRRLINCPTDVEVRFYNVRTGVIDSQYTSILPASSSPVTQDFILFTVNVVLPEDMKPGSYMYAPVLRPKQCGAYIAFSVPPSEIFRVESTSGR